MDKKQLTVGESKVGERGEGGGWGWWERGWVVKRGRRGRGSMRIIPEWSGARQAGHGVSVALCVMAYVSGGRPEAFALLVSTVCCPLVTPC